MTINTQQDQGYPTYPVYFASVQEDGWKILTIPPEYHTEELCLAAVTKSPGVLNRIRVQFKTRAVCMAAVSQNGVMLRYTPLKHKDMMLCCIAVGNNPEALAYVPRGMRAEVCPTPVTINTEEVNLLIADAVNQANVKTINLVNTLTHKVNELEHALNSFHALGAFKSIHEMREVLSGFREPQA